MAQCVRGARYGAAWRPATWHVDRWALFIDVDAWFDTMPAGSPGVPIRTLALLGALHESVSGALALVSRHPIAAIDDYLYPLRAACAGLQGLERRDARGGEHRLRTDARLAHVRSMPHARDLVSEVTLATFMAEAPFAGRRPLLFGPRAVPASIEHYLARLGGGLIKTQPRNIARDHEQPFNAAARSLLGEPESHETLAWARVDWARPSTAQ
jgi:hypothetical protein